MFLKPSISRRSALFAISILPPTVVMFSKASIFVKLEFEKIVMD